MTKDNPLRRRTGRRFVGQGQGTQMHKALLRQGRVADRIAITVRVAYFFPAFWICHQALDWQAVALTAHPEWLWPVAWLGWLDGTDAAPALFGGCAACSVLGALFSEFRTARVVAFLGLLEFLALKFSLGKIHHLMHGWLLLLFVLIWLPHGYRSSCERSRRTAQQTIVVYVAAQLIIATTYTLAGVGKLLGALYQLAQGEVTAFHPSSLSRHIAARLLETNDVSLWGPWLIERGDWLWPLMLGTLYLQLFAVVFAMRPSLHHLLGYGLVAFHALAPLSLMIDFSPAIVLCGTLYVASAVAPERSSLEEALCDLPLVGGVARVIIRRERSFVRSTVARFVAARSTQSSLTQEK